MKTIRAGFKRWDVFLENESVRIPWDGESICITGLEIGLDGYRKFGRRPMEEEEIESRVGTADSSYQILLAHNPAYVAAYRKWGADLILLDISTANRKDSGNRRRDRSGLYPVSQILGRHLQGRGCYGSRKQGLRCPLRPHPSVKSGGNGSSCAEWGLKTCEKQENPV